MTMTAPSGRRPRPVSLTPAREATAKSMLRLAAELAAAHPQMGVHQHLEDAARQVRAGNEDGALRHLRAAVYGLQPGSLHRHGIHDDTHHTAAAQSLQGVIRHHYLVKDLQDVQARNQAAISRDSCGDDTTSPPLPRSPLQHGTPYDPAPPRPRVRRQPGGGNAMNAPPVVPSGPVDPAVAKVRKPPVHVSGFAWDDLAAAVELSARTPMLESTPAPYGRPGGPGLYHLKNNKHSDYFENVVQALIRKRGMDKARASRIAWAALRRWQAKSKHPEVRDAAARGLMQEEEAAARARAAHSHAVTWDEVAGVVDLAVVQVKTYQRTVNTPAGPKTQTIVTHPQNYKQGAGGTGAPAQAAQQKYQAPPSKAAEKQRLLATAASYRRQAALLSVQLAALPAALSKATAAGTAAAPAGAAGAAGAAAPGAPSAAQAAALAAKTAGVPPAQITQAAAAAQTAGASMSAAQLRGAIAKLQARIQWLNSQAQALTTQAMQL